MIAPARRRARRRPSLRIPIAPRSAAPPAGSRDASCGCHPTTHVFYNEPVERQGGEVVCPAALCETLGMDVPSPAQDALAQPTRARLFALLGSLHRPAPTEELAERVGLHPNGVRVHLERLAEDGLVTR